MSTDGTKIVGAIDGGGIWTSSDSGATWIDRSTAAGSRKWQAVALSQSSDVIYGVVANGGVYKSLDFGATWSLTSAPICNYVGVATSGSTNVSVACAGAGTGRIYVNTNAGIGDINTWPVSVGTSGLNFTDLESSSDGTKLIASVWQGGVYTANDGTFSYVNKMTTPLTTYAWSAVGINSDGTKLIATSRLTGGNVYTSTDSGATWIASSGTNGANRGGTSGDWISAAISSDGSTLVAATFSSGGVTVSRDDGATWAFQNLSRRNFIETTVCGNGGRLAVGSYGTTSGNIFQAVANDALSGLAISSGTLSSTFNSCTPNYTASVANTVSSITVTPTRSQANATITVNGTSVASGSASGAISLSLGSNTISVVVTAPDGTTTKSYTLTVFRGISGITWNDQGATTASNGGATTYVHGSAVASIPTTAPQKNGHTFIGWFTSASSGRQVTNGSFTPAAPFAHLTFYAHWRVNKLNSPGTWTWTNQSAAGARNWHALATSADGTKLFAGVDSGGALYRSTDFGVNWSSISDTNGRNWFSIASNLDGTKVAAVDRGGDVWTSVDSGSTWTQRVVGGSVRSWESIASSSDGTKLVAVASNGSSNGFIHTSSDGGATWSANLAPSGNNKFTGVTSSNDGTYLAVTTWANGIYTSNNSGQTWTLRTLPVPNVGGDTHLQAVASSGDGSRLVTGSRLSGASNGGIIFTSADYGATWKAYSQTNLDYINFTSNGDGSRLAATIYGQAGVSTSADFGATWSFQSVGASGQISIASNIDGSLLFVGGYGGNLWTGKVPNARVVAVLPSSTSANLAATSSTPATAISFSASSAAVAMTVTPISNPTTEALTPFSVSQASVFDISVVNVSGQVNICVDGGPNVRLWHYTNGAWEDVTTSQTATQTCGLTSSFSPFATASPVVVAPSTPVVVYIPPAPIPYLKTLSPPQIRKSGNKLMCTSGTYNTGYTLDGVVQGSETALYAPASYTFNLLLDRVTQNSLTVKTSINSATWDLSSAPSGSLVSCSVTVTANSLTNTDASTADSSSVSAALTTQSQSLAAAESAYNASVSANSTRYQKALVENRSTWRVNVDKVKTAYLAELNRINGLPATKANSALKSAALKTYIAAQKKTAVDYKASGPAALAVRDLANKEALEIKKAAIVKANAVYGAFIESIGYGVLVP
jgi:uncharacterized repeat protein (TIGR02543 family)